MEHKKRIPLVAAFMSILAPGVGQIYNGQVRKGIFLNILVLFTGWAVFYFDIYNSFFLKVFLIIFVVIAALYSIIDAYRVSEKTKEIKLRYYNRWYVYSVLIILSFSIEEIIIVPQNKNHTFKSYEISNNSMEPTLSVGDRIIVDTRNKGNIYHRGDIVIFDYLHKKPIVSAKRVIGLPGEKIEIKNKQVLINNFNLIEPYIKHVDSTIFPTGISNRDNMGPVTIPLDCFFLMGDNRDLSYDSRDFICVDIKSIHGKATFIYWASSAGKIGKINNVRY